MLGKPEEERLREQGPILMSLESDTITGILSPARIELLRELHHRGPAESLGELAARLERDLAAVSRDVSYLEGFGLVEKDQNGRAKRFRATGRPILIHY